MPVDFAAPGRLTSEDRERMARERAWARDDAERDEGSRKAVSITLTREPEFRALPSGDRVMLLHGRQRDAATPLYATYVVPDRVRRDEDRMEAFDRMAQGLGGGDRVSLAGQWSKRRWRDQAGEQRESWEFKARHLARGDLPLERVKEISRLEPGGSAVPPQVERAARHAARGAMDMGSGR